MDWTKHKSKHKLMFQTDVLDCLWWKMTSGDSLQAFALLAATRLWLSTWCLRKVEQAHEFCFLSRASATCIHLCHFFFCSIWIFLLAVSDIHSHTHTLLIWHAFSSWEHETRQHLWSEFCHGRCMISMEARLCLSVCLCVSVCVWCPFMTWRYSIFTSHGSIFIISLDQECACSCYFVQWAMILGPWRQILFL